MPTPRGWRLRGSPWRPPHRARPAPQARRSSCPRQGAGEKSPRAAGEKPDRLPPPGEHRDAEGRDFRRELPRGRKRIIAQARCVAAGAGEGERRPSRQIGSSLGSHHGGAGAAAVAGSVSAGRARDVSPLWAASAEPASSRVAGPRAPGCHGDGRGGLRYPPTRPSPFPPSLGRDRMSQGDSNPAAMPHIAEDVQGDGRWMSQVSLAAGGLGRAPGAALERGPRSFRSFSARPRGRGRRGKAAAYLHAARLLPSSTADSSWTARTRSPTCYSWATPWCSCCSNTRYSALRKRTFQGSCGNPWLVESDPLRGLACRLVKLHIHHYIGFHLFCSSSLN